MKTQVSEEIKERCEELIINETRTSQLMDLVLNELNKGLSKKENPTADLKCFITYIKDLPNGEERGKFLALDLGGTNFRVLIIHLKDEHDFEMQSKIYAVPQNLMVGRAEELFDHIADCLANFMKDQNVFTERLSLGFTFSFPLQQIGLTKGLLVKWTKGFNVAGVAGEDVVKLLKDAIKRRGDIQIEICAILNDTTGTLMSCAWKNHNCRIGLIVGTGSNACYVEKIDNIETYEGLETNQMIINIEWGALGDNGSLEFIRTSYDRHIDDNSMNRGKQIFEKMISGMYMGELVRLILLKFTSEGLLFNGMDSELLRNNDSFETKYVSKVELDEVGNYKNCMEVMHKLGLRATFKDCANVRYICECVSRRSAHLVSAGIACLINKMNEKSVTVGVDGSVYRYHPKYHDLMVKRIRQFTHPDISFDLMLSEDGSGRGAALVAAVACREEEQVYLKQSMLSLRRSLQRARSQKKAMGKEHKKETNFFSNFSKLSDFLQEMVLLPMKHHKDKSSPKQYSPEIRKFALSLHYYSPAAYRFVITTMNKCLPHPKTIADWYRVIDGQPGFTIESLDTLVELQKKTPYTIVSLVLDGMALNTFSEWGIKLSGTLTVVEYCQKLMRNIN